MLGKGEKPRVARWVLCARYRDAENARHKEETPTRPDRGVCGVSAGYVGGLPTGWRSVALDRKGGAPVGQPCHRPQVTSNSHEL